MILLLFLACSPTTEPPVWEALDVDAIEQRIANPTATISGLEDRLTDVLDVVRAAVELRTFPEGILSTVLAGPDAEAPPINDVYAGTSVFVQVACPGSGTTPDPDFGFGYLELDSPLLVSESFRPIIGPLLIQLRGCEAGLVSLEGEVRARWVPDQERLFASGGLTIGVDGRSLTLQSDLDIQDGRLAFRVPIADGFATVVVTQGPAAEVRFADGVFVCSFDGELSCASEG